MGRVFLPDKWASESTGFIDKTVTEVLEGKYTDQRKPHSFMLEAYKETTVFIPVDII